MTRARCIRLLTLAALLVFAVYVFAPCVETKLIPVPAIGPIPGLDVTPAPHVDPETTTTPTDLEAPEKVESVTTGVGELASAFNFVSLRECLRPLLAVPSWNWLRQLLNVYGNDIAQQGLLLLAAVILSQVPLLASPRLPVRPQVCRVLTVGLLFCAASLLCIRVDFLIEQSRIPEGGLVGAPNVPGAPEYPIAGHLAFGAWLAPLAFALAGTALFLRRKEARTPRGEATEDGEGISSAPDHSAMTRPAHSPTAHWPRRLAIAALVVFVAGLYSPCHLVDTSQIASEPTTALNGVTDLANTPDLWSWPRPPQLVYEAVPSLLESILVWHYPLGDLLQMLASAGVLLLPLWTSPRFPLRPRACRALAIFFVLSAAGVVWLRLDFLPHEVLGPLADFGQLPVRLAFGAWLAPVSFLLAAAAVFLRRKEAALSVER